MSKQYDFAVFIGRFQPFHLGHVEVITRGLEIADKVVILVGSSNRPRSLRNPFTYEERLKMITVGLHRQIPGSSSRFNVLPLPDAAYDDTEWVANVQAAIRTATAHHVSPKIAIIGSEKDNSTYYLRLFPQWSFECADLHADDAPINSTAIRDTYFEGGNHLADDGYEAWLPSSSVDFMRKWRGQHDYAELMGERTFIKDYQAQWGKGPFMTTDAVVVQSGHVLLIERGQPPGVGKMALPGGFLNPDETLLQGCLRELEEETGLVIGDHKVPQFLKAQHTFDDVHRSPRARIITTGFLFELMPGPLLTVEGRDDAAKAMWVEIAALRTDEMFSDHAFIIRKLLNKAKG